MSNQGYDTVVDTIMASNTVRLVRASDFDSANVGRTTWNGAIAFINYLNPLNRWQPAQAAIHNGFWIFTFLRSLGR